VCWCGYQAGARCRLFAYGPADATASQNPIISCLIHIQTGITVLVPAYPGCPEKSPLSGCGSGGGSSGSGAICVNPTDSYASAHPINAAGCIVFFMLSIHLCTSISLCVCVCVSVCVCVCVTVCVLRTRYFPTNWHLSFFYLFIYYKSRTQCTNSRPKYCIINKCYP